VPPKAKVDGGKKNGVGGKKCVVSRSFLSMVDC